MHGALLAGLVFELLLWWSCRVQLNNTSKHAHRSLSTPIPPGLRGEQAELVLYPREASACWAPKSCTWPLQPGAVKRRIKTSHGPHHINQLSVYLYQTVVFGDFIGFSFWFWDVSPSLLWSCVCVSVCHEISFFSLGAGALTDSVTKPIPIHQATFFFWKKERLYSNAPHHHHQSLWPHFLFVHWFWKSMNALDSTCLIANLDIIYSAL